jgi:tetratricopeptide (TPR) repeat protein
MKGSVSAAAATAAGACFALAGIACAVDGSFAGNTAARLMPAPGLAGGFSPMSNRSPSGEPAPGARNGAFSRVPRPVTAIYVPWKPSEPLAMGVEYWSRGVHDKALRKFIEAVRVRPNDPTAWHNMGVALFEYRRYKEAFFAFRHERFLTPVAPSAWYGEGQCLMALGRYAEAENAFVMGVVEAPREWVYWHWLSQAQLKQGKAEAARVAAGNAARLKPRPVRWGWTPGRVQRAILDLKVPIASRVR